MVTGEIKIGDSFIWEPRDPGAYEHIVVTDIKINGGVTHIESKGVKGQHWNDETRFREACVRQETQPATGTGRLKGKFQAIEVK